MRLMGGAWGDCTASGAIEPHKKARPYAPDQTCGPGARGGRVVDKKLKGHGAADGGAWGDYTASAEIEPHKKGRMDTTRRAGQLRVAEGSLTRRSK